MAESETFDSIDLAIESFKKNEGFGKSIKVSKKSNSDWLIFNYRQLTWRNDNINYQIEIFPSFDEKQNISSWTLLSAAWYDLGNRRFYTNHSFAKEKDLAFIEKNIHELLTKSFNYITNIPKESIPAVA